MRSVCASCARPTTVCLCEAMPSPPLTIRTRLLVLQHPHERKHKLATVPVLARCVHPCHVVLGRRLHSCNWPFGDATGSTLLLFPGPDAVELQSWHNENLGFGDSGLSQASKVIMSADVENKQSHSRTDQMNENLSRTGNEEFNAHAQNVTLVVMDGTWEHAQEMMKASFPFLSPFVTQVCLPFDIHSDGHGVGESDLIMRKEPFGGCVSTMEAVARSLAILEPHGDVLETKLMHVLRKMVSLQASHFGSPKIRPKLKKKSKE